MTVPGFDERLTRELERAARPAAPDHVRLFDDVTRRRARRDVVRKVQVVTSVVVVLALVGGAVLWLAPRFSSVQPATPTGDGTLIFDRIVPPSGTTTSWWSVAPDGTGLAALPAPPFGPSGATWGASPAFSPDGAMIAYLSGGSPDEMMIANADGTDAHAVGGETFLLPPFWSQPGYLVRWSPDGSQVAFAEGPNNIDTETTQKPVAGIPMNDIRVVDASTGEGRTIQMPGNGIQSFDWAPDGSSFVVATVGTKDARGDLKIVDLDGHIVRTLTSGIRTMAPAWSPDGSTIAFLALGGAGGSARDVWTVPAAGGTATRVTDGAKTGTSALGVAWSPDANRLAYAWTNPTVGGSVTPDFCGISLIAPDGSDARQIGNQDTLGGCPRSLSWGPTPNMGPQAPTANPAMLQLRPVLEIVPRDRPGAPTPTCLPDRCTLEDLSARQVVLLDAAGVTYVLGPTILDGASIVSGAGVTSITSATVGVTLDRAGTAALARATRAAIGAPRPQNQIADVWDGEVVSAPTVQAVVTSGSLQIPFRTATEANAMLTALASTPSPGA